MPKASLRRAPKVSPSSPFSNSHVIGFLGFCKKFRKTMRSLVFIQYFSVGELLRLKLVHSQLNDVIDQDVILTSIQIGNLSPQERELYWRSKMSLTMEGITQMCPPGMINLIKNSNDFLLTSIRSTLMTNLPNLINHDEEVMNRMIAHLFVEKKLYRIYEDHSSVSYSSLYVF